jgi:hypothetical protein
VSQLSPEKIVDEKKVLNKFIDKALEIGEKINNQDLPA